MVRRVYVDGIWDCFHMGHVLHFKNIKNLDNIENFLIVGIISDNDAENYKRKPVYNEENRKILVESCKYVDEIIFGSSLTITEDFIKKHNIDLVCHGFIDKNDSNKQNNFFKIPKKLNKFRIVEYNKGISTSEIIENIKKNY